MFILFLVEIFYRRTVGLSELGVLLVLPWAPVFVVEHT